MAAPISTEFVWNTLAENMFAVLSWVSPKHSARSAGIIYLVRNHKLVIGAEANSWKAKHIRNNPNVSITATFNRRIPFIPWIHLPDATITFHGKARVIEPSDADPAVVRDLMEGMVDDPELMANSCVIEIDPQGDFITYGIGVSLMAMRDPRKAHGRVPVAP